MTQIVLTRRKLDRIKALVATGIRVFEESDADARRQALVPNKPVRNSEWLQDNLYMPPEMTDRPGPVRLDKMQRGIADVFQEPGCRIVPFQKPPRWGATTMVAGLLIKYAAHDGQDVFYTERSDDPLNAFYKKFVFPLLTCEAGKVAHMKRPDGKNGRQDTWTNTILSNGAAIQLRSASTDGAFRQLKAPLIVLDECSDKAYRAGKADSEGDKPSLAWKRAGQFRNPVMFLPSTPTDESYCIVSREYKKSDQRVYEVPCPHCGKAAGLQQLLPKVGEKEGPALKFRADPTTGKVLTYVDDYGNEMPDIWYECQFDASHKIREHAKAWMIENGDWRATREPDQPGIFGFYSWAIYSSHPQSGWAYIVQEYLASLADPSLRQSFKNLVLALPWTETEKRVVPVNELQARAEPYPAPCPKGVLSITIGGDMQRGRDDGSKVARGEFVVNGWGFGEECWVLGHFVIEGTPFSPSWTEAVYAMLDRVWETEDGRKLKHQGCGIDIGYDWDHAIEFCHRPESVKRRIFAVRGLNTRERTQTGHTPQAWKKNPLFKFLAINKQTPTDVLNERLRVDRAGPGAIHFPKSLPTSFYEGLTDYRRVSDVKKRLFFWEKGDDSEVYDGWIYAYAILRMLILAHPEMRARILARKGTGGVESAPAGASAYRGDDRSVGSDLSGAISASKAPSKGRLAGYLAQTRVAKPAPVRPQASAPVPPRPKSAPRGRLVTW